MRYPRFPLFPMIKVFGFKAGFKLWWSDQLLGNRLDKRAGLSRTITIF